MRSRVHRPPFNALRESEATAPSKGDRAIVSSRVFRAPRAPRKRGTFRARPRCPPEKWTHYWSKPDSNSRSHGGAATQNLDEAAGDRRFGVSAVTPSGVVCSKPRAQRAPCYSYEGQFCQRDLCDGGHGVRGSITGGKDH